MNKVQSFILIALWLYVVLTVLTISKLHSERNSWKAVANKIAQERNEVIQENKALKQQLNFTIKANDAHQEHHEP